MIYSCFAYSKTEQARKDLERLAIIKKKRAEDAAKRELTGRKPGMSAHGLDDDADGSSDSSDEEVPDTNPQCLLYPPFKY